MSTSEQHDEIDVAREWAKSHAIAKSKGRIRLVSPETAPVAVRQATLKVLAPQRFDRHSGSEMWVAISEAISADTTIVKRVAYTLRIAQPASWKTRVGLVVLRVGLAVTNRAIPLLTGTERLR